jgi:phosphate:Na+ symporter
MKRIIFLLILLPIFSYGINLNHAISPDGRNISGDNQITYTRNELNKPLLLTATDSLGIPIGNLPIKFICVSGPELIQLKDTVYTTDNFGNVKYELRIPNSEGRYIISAFSKYKGKSTSIDFKINAVKKGWLVILIIKILGGFALFLFGLKYSANGLKRYAGERLKHFLWEYTSSPCKAYLSGMGLTFLLQSSTALSVMLVSLANAGLISFTQNIAVLLGASLGTTLTVQILAFNIYDYALLIVLGGFILMNLKGRIHYIGRGIFGFGIIFFAISIMSGAIFPIKNMPWFTNMFISLQSHLFLLFLISFIITALVHSSALTIGISILLAIEQVLPINSAFIIVLGANLGTSSTALFASIPADPESKRTAISNFVFKLIMVIAAYFALNFLAQVVSITSHNTARQIANFHTLINLIASILFLIISKPFAKFIKLIIRDNKNKPEMITKYLDNSIIDTPEIAIGHAQREIIRTGDIIGKMLKKSKKVIKTYENGLRKRIIANDDVVDNLVDKITKYITEITKNEISDKMNNKGISFLYIINEFENVGDVISKTLMAQMNKLIKGNLCLSDEGKQDLLEFYGFILETYSMAMNSIITRDKNLTDELIKRRALGGEKLNNYHRRHLERISLDIKQTIETSAIHLDMISAIERINYHFSRIGLHIKDTL